MKKPPIRLRGETWWLRKRVPKRFGAVEARKEVNLSLHTDSKATAEGKWRAVWDNLVEGWEAKIAGDTTDAAKRHAAAVELAAIRGFRYLPTREFLELPLETRIARVEAASDQHEAAALLGTTSRPKLTVNNALDEYWGLTRDMTLNKSPDQLRRWKNPRKKAIKNFIRVSYDKPIDEIKRDDLLDFREWLLERIIAKEITPNSGNKDLGHLGDVLKTVNRLKRLGLDLAPILSELTFKEGEKRTRPPFSTKWIKQKILAPDALAGMNKEARCVVLAMINTGARPSELTTLNSGTIDLISRIPSITIKTDGREVKTQSSLRTIPLLGVSLAAFQECPKGFLRYFDKPGLSATVNSFFTENGLRETPEHSFYSLRHSFEDRMLAAEIDERVRRDLMGHSLGRQRYGKGAELDHAARLLKPLAL